MPERDRTLQKCAVCQEPRPYAGRGMCTRCWQRQPYVVAARKERTARQYAAFKALTDKAKSKPCMDCLVRYPPEVMDLDHREGEEKFMAVAQMFRRRLPLTVVQAEIDKCDVVCSNCHRLRTMRRRKRTA